MSEFEIFLRLLTASAAGALLGLDREMRGISAGLRTHAMASLSSAVIIVSSILIHDQLTAAGETGIDPLRAIQGLAQAIGFIAAGAIFFANGNVRNLTSAANIWLAAGLGIAAGAGQYVLVAFAVAFGVFIVTGLRFLERLLPGSDKSGNAPGD
ncbi:MAG: MgtC/SapB family protein [Bauldia sp.]|jgi:putative Mg2+ transporter-C (MgtC) family protein